MPDEVISRMYDPTVGRFWQVDPMAPERDWLSPYNFVQNNPINRVDPTGALDWVQNGEGEIYWDKMQILKRQLSKAKIIWVRI